MVFLIVTLSLVTILLYGVDHRVATLALCSAAGGALFAVVKGFGGDNSPASITHPTTSVDERSTQTNTRTTKPARTPRWELFAN